MRRSTRRAGSVVGGTDCDGFGFVFRTLDIGETTTPGLMQQDGAATINDVLIAALHLTVASWNVKHDVPTDRVGIQMPINIRPADRSWEVVNNLTSMVSVSTEPDDRMDLATVTNAVAKQTSEMRRNDRAYGLYDLLDVTKKLPLIVKRVVPKLIHLTGDRFVDTAMLSNLGCIPEPLTFAADPRSRGSPRRATLPVASLLASSPADGGFRWGVVPLRAIRCRRRGKFTDLLIAQIAR